MKSNFLAVLACPYCKNKLVWQSLGDHGWLICEECISKTPVIHGFPLFTATKMVHEKENLDNLAAKLFSTNEHYQSYIEQKKHRNLIEPYTAFQPFNESLRCLNAIVPTLKSHLKENDVILDTHNWSGWTGGWLAGMFPKQLIISIWEGDSGVLGYKGFSYWFSHENRPKNLLIIFSPANQPWPIKNKSITFLHGYDVVHKYPQPYFSNQCLAACHSESILVFPHIHMSNNQPNPWFDRGGSIRHGKDYRTWFKKRLKKTNKVAILKSELDIFLNAHLPEFKWEDDSDTKHYNGFLIIANLKFLTNKKFNLDQMDARLITNPFLRINPLTKSVTINHNALNRQADYIFQRHPAYYEYLRQNFLVNLTNEMCSILIMAEQGFTLQEIIKQTNLPQNIIHSLIEHEIVTPAPINLSLHQLQQFFCNNQSIFCNNFQLCWDEWVIQSPQKIAGTFNEVNIYRQEAQQITHTISCYLHHIGINSGDQVIIKSEHPDIIWIVVACYLVGAKPHYGENNTAKLLVTDFYEVTPFHQINMINNLTNSVTLMDIIETFWDNSINVKNITTDEHWRSAITLDENERLTLI